MSDRERKRVNLRVDEDVKEKWDAYVDESDEYATLSGLIRASVNAEIADDDGRDADDGASDGRAYGDRFDELEARLDDIRDAVEAQHTDEPPADVGDEPDPYPESEVFQALPDDETAVTAAQVADKLAYGPEIVTQTLELIESKSASVTRERVGDTTVYSKEV